MKKEFLIFLSLFLFLAIGMHFSAWISHPIEHIQALPDSPLGLFHPLYITLIVYLLILVLRSIVKVIQKVFSNIKK
jgi:ABC-type multidrug transport system fused ATPase/permease subunit